MRVGVGDTLKALVIWEPHESPHEGTQANTEVGDLDFINCILWKTPWWFRSRPKAMVLERKCISANPQRIFGYGKSKVLRNLIFYLNLFYEIVKWHKYLIFDDLHECFVLVCFELRLWFLISFFRAHYIPPTCTHETLPPHWVPRVLILSLFNIFAGGRLWLVLVEPVFVVERAQPK